MKSKLVIIILAALLFACAGPSTLADLWEKYGPLCCGHQYIKPRR
jgi:hypothetical protein